MNRFFRLISAAMPLLLAACTPALLKNPGNATSLSQQQAREQALAGVNHWTIQGHLFVTDGHQGGNGTLTWTQNGDSYDFMLRAPITGQSFHLSGNAGGARLEGLNGGPLIGPDAETVMQKALGWEVPLADLRAWALGIRATGASGQMTFGADNLPSQITQDGWTVTYPAWDATRKPPLPVKVFAAKPPYKVKLAVDSWTLQ